MPALADILATLYDDRASAERIMRAVGLEPGRVNLDGSAQSRWSAILAHARAQHKVAELILVAYREYPDYEPLRDAVTVELNLLDRADAPPVGWFPEMMYGARAGEKLSTDPLALHRLNEVERTVAEHGAILQRIMPFASTSRRRLVGRSVAAIIVVSVCMAWMAYLVDETKQVYDVAPLPAVLLSASLLAIAGLILWLAEN